MHPAPEPDALIVLSEGAANRLQGDWPDRSCPQVSRLELHHYRSPGPARGRALVYAGGGYLQLVHDKEGVEIARWLNALGLDAYVLMHRLPGQADGHGGVWPLDQARQDGLRCMDHLAGLPPLPLVHVGLSSGGHLAGVMACQDHAVRACGALICYAPLNANHRRYKAPAGKPDYPPAEKQAFYDAWPIGIAGDAHGLPRMPVFLACALHDAIVPIDHALNFIKAMQQTGGQVDAHVFAEAPHGFALRDLNGTLAQWPDLAARWLDQRLLASPGSVAQARPLRAKRI